ncbi:MAG: zf-TFIIB domain-containing protein [Acidobacteriota bacterium]
MAFDNEDLRKGRENDWFRQNEEKLIAAARQRRDEAERAQKGAVAEARRAAHWRKCPKCGSDMAVQSIADIEIEKCSSCEGIFFDRGELEQLLMKQESQRRGFFRKLLGFSE